MSDPSTRDNAFALSDSQINFANVLAFTSTIPGTCIGFLVLVAYGIAAFFPTPRKQLDRVSLRLLVLTLFFNVIFGIAYAATPASPGAACNFGAFVVNFTLSFSTFFTTCIAINLELVLVHGVNGKRMEKYYLIGTTILSLALNVPTFALHKFGWDDQSLTCWYKNSNDQDRLRWIIGTQSFWILLAATIETICSCIVLVWIYRFKRDADLLIKAAYHSSVNQKSPNTQTQTRPIGIASFNHSTVISRNFRYRNVILRIALYPIISLLLNYSTVALDLYTTIHGLTTEFNFQLLLLDLILYGVRTSAYGILAACDPSFINAAREVRARYADTAAPRTLSVINFVNGPGATGKAAETRSETVDHQHDALEGELGSKPDALKTSDMEKSTTGQLSFEEIRDFEKQL
ncbi:hypothetical protein C8J56DRAFT_420875 [Mycena floridula]|nr:hypothetical protein C8J56DRAFT_420875 [Mycena floridula]